MMPRCLLLPLFALLLPLSACQKPTVPVLVELEDGVHVRLEVGQELQVQLASNPSTGFTWQSSTHDRRIVEQQGKSVYIAGDASGELMGAGGTTQFNYRALKTGTTEVHLAYRRPWLPESQAAKSLRIVVEVLAQAKDRKAIPAKIVFTH